MKAGEIVEVGTHQSLLEQAGEYHSLHALQRI
jgi:ABC-type multidrug transport system fused ATPase/permease subunit